MSLVAFDQVSETPPTNQSFEERLNEALTNQMAGKTDAAIQIYEELLPKHPDHPELNHRLGMAYFITGNPDKSLPLVEKSLALKDDIANYHSNYGVVLQALGRHDEAGECFKKSVELDPKDHKAWFNYARFCTEFADKQDAMKAYQAAIKIKPDYVEAVHNMVGLLMDQNDFLTSEAIIDRTLAICPDDEKLIFLKALYFQRKGQLKKAVALLKELLKTPGKEDFVYSRLAVLYRDDGRLELSVEAIRRGASFNKEVAIFYADLGQLFIAQDRIQDGLDCYRHMLEILGFSHFAHMPLRTQYADLLEKYGRWKDAEEFYRYLLVENATNEGAMIRLGRALQTQGEYKEAIKFYQEGVELKPEIHAIYALIGVCYRELKQNEKAIEWFQKAIDKDPKFAEAYGNMANCYRALDRNEEAIQIFHKVIEINPELVTSYINLGTILKEEERFEEAHKITDIAKEKFPDEIEVEHVRAMIHAKAKEYDRVEEICLRIIAQYPDYAPVYATLGMSYRQQNKFEQALEFLSKAQDILPENEQIRLSVAMLKLSMGNFKDAWDGYQDRPTVPRDMIPKRDKKLPQNMEGKTVLLVRDQGIGDELFFMRFAPEIKARGAKAMYYLANEKIASIVERFPFLDGVHSSASIQIKRNFTISVGDLPHLLDINDEDLLRAPIPMSVDEKRLPALRRKLKKMGPPPYIGVTWRAGTLYKGALFKETPIEIMGKTLSDVEGTLLALQRLPEEGDIAEFEKASGRKLHDLTALNEDVEEMLALLELMDAYVCVSNTNVHLREGLGKVSHVMIPNPPDFRWMTHGDRSPWFPSSHVFRQKSDGDWHDAYQAMKKDLTHFLTHEPVTDVKLTK